MKIRDWVVGAVTIAMLTIGVTGFISDGLSVYGVGDNVDMGELNQLEEETNKQLDQSNLADNARKRAENVESKSNFFTLPGLINTFKLGFQSIGIWDSFARISLSILGLGSAHGGWPRILVTSIIAILVAFKFAERVLN